MQTTTAAVELLSAGVIPPGCAVFFIPQVPEPVLEWRLSFSIVSWHSVTYVLVGVCVGQCVCARYAHVRAQACVCTCSLLCIWPWNTELEVNAASFQSVSSSFFFRQGLSMDMDLSEQARLTV